MSKQITISNITGSNNPPYNIYLCESDFTSSCSYINTITNSSLPYTFSIPSLSASMENFGVIISGAGSCVSSKIVNIPNPTPTPTPTPTLTPTATPVVPTPTPVPEAFISRWTVNNPGDTITLPLVSSGNYNFIVDWGDGNTDTITAWNDPAITHTYATSGEKTVQIYYTIEGWSFNAGGDSQLIVAVDQWGPLRLGNDGGYFYGCFNLDLSGVVDILDTTGTSDFTRIFSECLALTTINNINSWDVSNVTNMSFAFAGPAKGAPMIFDDNLGSWDVSNVTNMIGMFYKCLYNNGGSSTIQNWVVGSVTNMSYMFIENTLFNQPLNNWERISPDVSTVSNVTTLAYMFKDCTSFNQPLNNWDTSSVTTLYSTFESCDLFNQPLNNWDTSSVNNMSGTFSSCSSFDQDVSSWDVSNVTTMESMFLTCFVFDNGGNDDIQNWNVSQVLTMGRMFEGCPVFNRQLNNWERVSPDVSTVSNVTETYSMFSGCDLFNQPLNNWNVSSVTNMSYMFSAAINFNQNIGSWDVGVVNNANSMFNNATLFNNGGSPSIDNWDVSSLIDAAAMFNYADSFNQPLNSWDVTSVQYAQSMFANAMSFNQPLNNWRFYALYVDGSSNYGASGFMGNKTYLDYDCQYLADIYTDWGSVSALLPNGVEIDFGYYLDPNSIKYDSSGTAGRTTLLITNNWDIVDGGVGTC